MNRFIKVNLFTALSLLLLFSTSCQQQAESGEVSICGNAPAFAGTYLRLVRIDTAAYITVDSVKTDSEGHFCLNFLPEMAGFYLVQSGNKTLAPLVIYPGDSINALFRSDSIVFSSGREAGVFDRFRRSLLADEAVADSLGSVLILARDMDNYAAIKMKTDSAWADLMLKAKQRAIDFLEANKDFLSQILVVNSKIQQSFLFDQTVDSAWLFVADKQLASNHSSNPHYQAFHTRMKLLKATNERERIARENMSPGKPAPAISLPGLNGKDLILDPSKNKFTCVYFWSPADGPSRKANQELKSLHEKYKDSGFEVFAVSLDAYADRWAAAVNLDKLWWANVNDTRAMNSQVAKEWYIQKLPVFVLINRQGFIVDRYTSVRALDERLLKEL